MHVKHLYCPAHSIYQCQLLMLLIVVSNHPLSLMLNQQLNLINSITKDTSPILAFLLFIFSSWLMSLISVSLFQLNLYISKELSPNPLSLTLKALHAWAPPYLSHPIFHYFLESTTLAKLNHSASVYTSCFPNNMPLFILFPPGMLFFLYCQKFKSFALSFQTDLKWHNAFPGPSQVKIVSLSSE